MWANKVRAGLTILGVAIGVFVVVVMSATVHGINLAVQRQLQSAGPTTFLVTRFPPMSESCRESGDSCRFTANPPISFAELAALQRLETVDQAGARLEWFGTARAGDRSLRWVQLLGVTANWPRI